MNYLIYDLEICRAIPPKDPNARLLDIDYCGGWEDFENMGISCISWAIVDGNDGGLISAEVYLWNDFSRLKFMEAISKNDNLVTGFNTKKFDDRLMAANGVTVASDFDILELIIEAAGQKGKPYWEQGYSYSLAKIGAANGIEKTGTGENAPILWQQNKIADLITYCLNDATIEAQTLAKLLAGELIDPNTNQKLKVDKETIDFHFFYA
jgi:hypothetical protein